AGVSYQNQKINEPLQVNVMAMKPSQWSGTFIETSSKMLELTSCVYKGKDLYVRVFNAAKTNTEGKIKFNFDAIKATFVNLDETEVAEAAMRSGQGSIKEVKLNMKPFGITTLRVSTKEK
ncbi:glycosyl hydrolase-related protein, partial [Pedobacter sp.]|uniref:glycosyl hydrolase-related protein n=1 Tax=Pedobacter sp. TaxID=1411316 RepID=UPI003D7F58AD